MLPIFRTEAEVPWVPESFQVGASRSPIACHEDFGDDGVSQGCSCLKMMSLLPDCEGFADSVAQGLVCKLSSPGSPLSSLSIRCHSSRYAFWNVSPVGIQNGFHRHIHSVIKTISLEEGRSAKRRNAYSVACMHTLSPNQDTPNRKFTGIVLDSDEWNLWRVQIHVSFPGAVGCPCVHQKVVTFQRSEAYPECALDDKFE